MSASIIDGKAISRSIREKLSLRIEKLAAHGVQPGLAVVLIGEDPASVTYVNAKERDCEREGIYSRDIRLPKTTAQEDLLRLIEELNNDAGIHGILIQLPLPNHIHEESIIRAISPSKDVDGFHPQNMGALMLGAEGFLPCTPHGIIKILESQRIRIEGADVVVIGRSRIVGAPLANLLFRKAKNGNATVTVCHTRTVDLATKVRQADIVIAAAGQTNTVTADMISPGTVVIDVGVNRVRDTTEKKGYRIVGDVDFDAVKEVAKSITPVPGGVGPLTRTMLLWNTVESALIFHRNTIGGNYDR